MIEMARLGEGKQQLGPERPGRWFGWGFSIC